MSPFYLSALILFTFLFFMTYWATMMLGAIEVPAYQLPATDEKNKENNREWSHMWGNIEKNWRFVVFSLIKRTFIFFGNRILNKDESKNIFLNKSSLCFFIWENNRSFFCSPFFCFCIFFFIVKKDINFYFRYPTHFFQKKIECFFS